MGTHGEYSDVLSELLSEFRVLFGRGQFSRYISPSRVSSARSVAHLYGIFVSHTNQSNLNRFIRNTQILEVFRKSVSLISSYSPSSP
ncbi:MAG: hypothetical protein M1113_02620 [Candidatus Thermoplasmatota archaeon]|nr:hypothetical protein [Candidatus Thermoplasmatota archaeon]